MDQLPASVLDLVARLTRTEKTAPNGGGAVVEGALIEMFKVTGLPRRPFLWLDDISDAYLYLARKVQESMTRLTSAEQDLFHAAESAFDSAWVNAWPELLADCQIAAGKTGDVERMQAAYRQLNPFAASPEVVAIETACAKAVSALEDTDSTDGDLKFERIVRHQNNLAHLIQDFVPTLVVAAAPASKAAHIIAHEAVTAWECGGSVFWVRPDEIVLASIAR